MPSPVVVLAHTSETDALAQRVSDELTALGFSVNRADADAPRRQAAKIESAHRVVVLWSRAARGTPALRAAVRRASARGTLVCVSLDAAPPPAGVKRITGLPRSGAAWRSALLRKRPLAVKTKVRAAKAAPRPARRVAATHGGGSVEAMATQTPSRSAPILGFLATVLVFGAAVGAGLYQTDAAFAAKINALAGQARAEVTALTGKH